MQNRGNKNASTFDRKKDPEAPLAYFVPVGIEVSDGEVVAEVGPELVPGEVVLGSDGQVFVGALLKHEDLPAVLSPRRARHKRLATGDQPAYLCRHSYKIMADTISCN